MLMIRPAIPPYLYALTKQGVIECPIPDKDIRRFDANIRLFPPFIDNDICPLTINNTLLQSCYLRNTEWACGVAVYTGKLWNSLVMILSTTTTNQIVVEIYIVCFLSVSINSYWILCLESNIITVYIWRKNCRGGFGKYMLLSIPLVATICT
jgi:phospholipid-translocating ATPase